MSSKRNTKTLTLLSRFTALGAMGLIHSSGSAAVQADHMLDCDEPPNEECMHWGEIRRHLSCSFGPEYPHTCEELGYNVTGQYWMHTGIVSAYCGGDIVLGSLQGSCTDVSWDPDPIKSEGSFSCSFDTGLSCEPS
jgi:hypothetical protein